MHATAHHHQSDFLKEYIMARHSFDPRDFGVDLDREQFDDLMVEEFHNTIRGWTIDELLLRPRNALQFCDGVRAKHGWLDLPDDAILRVILQRRKNP